MKHPSLSSRTSAGRRHEDGKAIAEWRPIENGRVARSGVSAELLGRCKVFLQAVLDGRELYQSATQRYTRWYCVFNVPIIICTNDWSSAAVKIDWELWAWIQENAVHVQIEVR